MRGGRLIARPTDLTGVVDVLDPQTYAAAAAASNDAGGPLAPVESGRTPVVDASDRLVVKGQQAADAVMDSNEAVAAGGRSGGVQIHEIQLDLSSLQCPGGESGSGGDGASASPSPPPCCLASPPLTRAFTFPLHPGLILIPGLLSPAVQRHLIRECLSHYPEPPSNTNHTLRYGHLPGLWAAAQSDLRLSFRWGAEGRRGGEGGEGEWGVRAQLQVGRGGEGRRGGQGRKRGGSVLWSGGGEAYEDINGMLSIFLVPP